MSHDILDFDEQSSYESTDRNVGFGIRLGAYLIDYLILSVVLYLIIFLYFGEIDTYALQSNPSGALGVYGITFLLSILYFIGMWAFADGATIGKKLVRIKVVNNEHGTPVTLGGSILRFIGYILSSIPCFLGFLWTIWDAEQRGWHDKISNTKVVSTD